IRQTALIAGRLPTAPGEVALDQPLFERLGAVPSERAMTGGRLEPLELSRLEGRDAGPAIATASAAGAFNSRDRLKLGDEIELVRFLRKPIKLKVVGVLAEVPFGGRWRAFMTLAALQQITGQEGLLTQVDIITDGRKDPEQVGAAHRGDLPPRTLLQT